jgi:hypothetical protein
VRIEPLQKRKKRPLADNSAECAEGLRGRVAHTGIALIVQKRDQVVSQLRKDARDV